MSHRPNYGTYISTHGHVFKRFLSSENEAVFEWLYQIIKFFCFGVKQRIFIGALV